MTITFHYSVEFARRALRSYMWRKHIKGTLGAWAVCCVSLIFTFPAMLGDSLWFGIVAIPGALVAVLWPVLSGFMYWSYLSSSKRRLKLLKEGEISVTVTDTVMIIESDVGKSEVNWSFFKEMDEYPEFYCLLDALRRPTFIPKDQSTPEFISFIQDKLRK